MPYAFTEQGIYMLATVLKGDLAIQQKFYLPKMASDDRVSIEDAKKQFNNGNEILK